MAPEQTPGGHRPPLQEVDWEILPPEEKQKRQGLEPIFRWVAVIMDGLVRVPGTKYRFGLNPIIDLIPAVGDVSAAFISASVLLYAIRRGLPKLLLAKMGVNVLLNELVGIIPFVGSAFAFWFRCNKRNYDLLQSHIADPRPPRRGDWILIFAVLGLLFLIVGTGLTISFLFLHQLLKLLTGL